MSQESISIQGIAGSSGVTEYTLVKMASGLIETADDTDATILGVAQNTAASGEALTVVISGKTLVKAAAAIVAGSTNLIGGTDSTIGQVTATHAAGTCYIVGAYAPRAQNNGAAQDCVAGDLIEINLYANKLVTRAS